MWEDLPDGPKSPDHGEPPGNNDADAGPAPLVPTGPPGANPAPAFPPAAPPNGDQPAVPSGPPAAPPNGDQPAAPFPVAGPVAGEPQPPLTDDRYRMRRNLGLRDYQHYALDGIRQHFQDQGDRVTLVMPCGTGKTRVAAELLRDTAHRRVVVLVPTIVLLGQIAEDMKHAASGHRQILVCSRNPHTENPDDRSIRRSEAEAPAAAGLDITTDARKLAAQLQQEGPILLVATYASADTVRDAVDKAPGRDGSGFDLAIADEAHRTAGPVDKSWGLVVRKEFRAKRRLFMTATPRIMEIREGDDEDSPSVVSMDGPAYGAQLVPLTFREAIAGDYLSEYRVHLVGIAKSRATELRRRIEGHGCSLEEVAALLALAQLHRTYPHVRSVLAYHNRVKRMRRWSEMLQKVHAELAADDPVLAEVPLVTFEMHSDTRMCDRGVQLGMLKEPGGNMVVVSNCHTMAEGVNIPALDAVLFAAPRSSTIDIIQIIGRAMRVARDEQGRSLGRPPALVIVPVLLADGDEDIDCTIGTSSYKSMWRVLQSLAIEDVQFQDSLATWPMNVLGSRNGHDARITVDLPPGMTALARHVFAVRVSSATPGDYQTASWVRKFHAENGNLDFPEGEWRPVADAPGFTFGPAVRRVRSRHTSKKLRADIEAQFEAIPGWDWREKRAPKEPAEPATPHVDAIERLAADGRIAGGRLQRTQVAVSGGKSINVSNWFYIQKKRGTLCTPAEQERLRKVIPNSFRR